MGHPYRMVLYARLTERQLNRQTARLTGWFYTPDLPAGFVPAARPASLTSSPTGSLTSGQTGQPHQ